MTMLKCFKKVFRQRRLLLLMKEENKEVMKYCYRRDWKNAERWLHKNKMSFKAYRNIEKL